MHDVFVLISPSATVASPAPRRRGRPPKTQKATAVAASSLNKYETDDEDDIPLAELARRQEVNRSPSPITTSDVLPASVIAATEDEIITFDAITTAGETTPKSILKKRAGLCRSR
jgi:hypothetical protein